MCAVSIERLIDRRIDKWKQQKVFQSGKHRGSPQKPIITISRSFGAGGNVVANAVAEEMNLVLFDRNLIDRIATEAKVNAKMVAALDENSRSAMESWVEGMLKKRIFDRSEYIAHLLKVLKSLALRGGCVILGRGANIVLKNEPAAYHFRIEAPLDFRVDRISKVRNVDIGKAKALIKRTDQERIRFMKDNFNISEADDPIHYHAVFNSSKMTFDEITDQIKSIVMNGEKNRKS